VDLRWALNLTLYKREIKKIKGRRGAMKNKVVSRSFERPAAFRRTTVLSSQTLKK
jgi:hypothetical protein